MQTTIVMLVLATAIAYAAWRTYKALSHGGDPCSGCGLARACTKKRGRRRHGCTDKQH